MSFNSQYCCVLFTGTTGNASQDLFPLKIGEIVRTAMAFAARIKILFSPAIRIGNLDFCIDAAFGREGGMNDAHSEIRLNVGCLGTVG